MTLEGLNSLQKPRHAGKLLMKDGSTKMYGVIELSQNDLIHYTGKGLNEIMSPKKEEDKIKAEKLKQLSRKELIEQEYIAITNLHDISKVLH